GRVVDVGVAAVRQRVGGHRRAADAVGAGRLALGRGPVDVRARSRALRTAAPAARPLGRGASSAGFVGGRVPAALPDQSGVRPALVARRRPRRRLRRARRRQQPHLDRSRRRPRRRRALDRQAAHPRLPAALPRRRRALTSLLATLELETGRPPTAAVIWLHGLGADGHDFEPIVPELDLPDSLPVRFVFPHAPMQPVTNTLAAEASTTNRDVPIFMAHGLDDPLIPLERARMSRKLLESAGYRVEWHEYPMAHSVCAEEIADISSWLRRVLST